MVGATSSKILRACEACRKRKVKCSGQSPCHACAHHGLRCIVLDHSRKASTRKAIKRGERLASLQTSPRSCYDRPLRPSGDLSSVRFEDDAITLPFTTFDELLSIYAETVFPTHPVITGGELAACFKSRHCDSVAAAVVYASAAATLSRSASSHVHTDERRTHCLRRLATNAIHAFGPLTPFVAISIERIMTCVFVANSMLAINDSNTAFLYLRHAISMMETFRMDSSHTSADTQWAKKQRLYWLLFIHERYQCISEYRTVLLWPLSDPPVEDTTIPDGVHRGFTQVVKLFRLLDSDFIDHWLGRQAQIRADSEWITSKCKQFYADEMEAYHNEEGLTLAQRADLIITRHWLATLLWRIAISHKVLHKLSANSLPLLFPTQISRRLRHSIENIPARDIESHGVGITQKLFELTDTMADVVLHFPSSDLGGSTDQLDDLYYLRQKIVVSTSLDEVRRGILDDKFQRLQATIPS